MSHPWNVVVALGVAVGALQVPTPASAQSCYSSQGRFYDDCNDSSGFYPPKKALVQQVGSKTLMFINTNFQVRVFDLANPDLPPLLSTLTMPFPPGCGLPFGCGNPHFQYEDTVYPVSVATLGSVGYAFVPLNGYGWDLLKATVSGTAVNVSWFNTGYHPPGNGGPYKYGALFTHNGQLFVVGQMLDQASVSSLDRSLRIYNLGASPSGDLYTSMGQGVRIPVGGPNDGPGYSTAQLAMGYHQFFVKEIGIKRVLFVYSVLPTLSNSWLAAFDITDPANPVGAAFVTYAADPTLFSGTLAFEQGAPRAWVAKVQGGTNASVSLWGYGITESNGAVSISQVSSGTWPLPAVQGAGGTELAAGYGLLVVGFMQVGKAFAISPSGSLTPLPDEPGYTDLSINLEEPCQYWELARGYMGLMVYPGPDNSVYFYRSAMKEGRMIKVASSCLTLAPTAQFSLTNSSTDEAQSASCGTADADGFPGDSFVVTDQSVGNITYKSFQIKDSGGNQVFSATWSPSGGWSPGLTWTTANTQAAGLYTAILTVGNGVDPDSTATKTIRLCADPQAQLTVTPQAASYLQNETVTFTSASAGHPTSVEYYVWAPGATTPAPQSVNQLTLASCGNYQVALVAHYAHAAPDDGDCGAWYSDTNPNGYDSCTAPVTLPVGAARLSFKVMQGNVETDFPLVGQDTVVQFTGQVASGYTASYNWSATANNQPVTIPGLTDCIVQTCTIPANTLTAGQPYTFSLQLQLSPAPGSCAPAPASKTITPTSASATMQIQDASGQPITQAAVGQTVRLKVTSYQNLQLSQLKFRIVGNESCEGLTEFPIVCFGQCVDYRDVTFKNQGSATVQLIWNSGSGEQVMDSKSLTLTPGSCPSACTYSVSPTSASYGASGGSGSFTVSTQSGCAWQAVPDVNWIQVTSGGSGVGSGTVSYTVAANSGGSRQGKIRVPDGASSVGVTVLQSGSGGGGGGNTLTITPNPAQVSTFPVTVTFSFSPALSQTGDTVTFAFGDGTQQTLTKTLGVVISSTTHTYTAPPSGGNVFLVTASGTIGGVSYAGSTQVTVACNAQAAPTAEFSWSPTSPRAGKPVQFTDASTGNPTSWQWDFGLPLGNDTSTSQNPTFTYPAAGTFTVTLTASNCKGSSTKQKQITLLPACGETAVPVADFTWEPAEPTHDQVCQAFPSQCQKQPYAGQKVKLVDASSNNPTDWHWYDFQELRADFRGQATVTVQWSQPGPKNVRLKAKNCLGESAEKLKTVTVYPDERPVTVAFTCSASPAVGQPVTCTADDSFERGNPTSFTWSIEDPKPGEQNPVTLSGKQVSYTFKCGGKRRVTLTAKRESFSGSSTQELEVSGSPCGPAAFVAADAAKVQGLNNTFWRTDLRIFNPSAKETRVHLDVLRPGQSNADPPGVTNLPLPPLGALVLDDVLSLFRPVVGDVSKASIRVRFDNPDGVPPVVVGRTYTDVPGGGTFGQLIPAAPAPPLSAEREQWITGIRHDGTGSEGFRSNVSLYNLRADRDSRVDLYLYDAQGQLKGAVQAKSLAPLGYEQAQLASLFNLATPPGVATLKLVLAEGSQVGVNASIVDNRTGDASLQTNEPKPTGGTLVIPGVSHAAGAAGSTWRSTVVLTNPDTQVHTYVLKLVPKGLPSLEKPLTLQAGETRQLEDVVAWIADPFPVPEASGVLLVSPDGGAFPAVSARTYNLAADGGTYGQTLKVFHAGNSAGGSTGYRKLYLTGMSSDDIARSNLGFVHVGGDTVNFKVWFYDETGNLLNPNNQPYTMALSATNPWDQDKLENRFRNKGWTLPANLRVISAVIQVEGGMGQAYASVVDNRTNDPIFIPAVPAP